MTWSTALRVVLLVGCVLNCRAAPTATRDMPPVTLDGRFDDWVDVAGLVDDPADAPGGTVDIGLVQARSDDRWLYVAIDVGRDVTIQGLPGTLRWVIDADASIATGQAIAGLAGADIVVDYSPVAAPDSERGAGVALWRPRAATELDGPISPYELDVTVMPVHAARRFEMRMARASADSSWPALGSSVRFKFVYQEHGVVIDETEEVPYAFDVAPSPAAGAAVAQPLAWVRPADRGLRVAHWNVSDDSFRDHPSGFARLLGAVDADILTLSELPGDVTEADVRAFFDHPALAARGSWQFALGVGGGRQRAVVAARNHPLVTAEPLADVRYDPAALDELWRAVPEAMQPAIDVERSRGVSSVGAWVDTAIGRFLVVALDLQSGGWVGSGQDQLRVLQARTVRARIDAALDAQSGAVIIGGDLNLVGSLDPMMILVSARAAGEELVPVESRRLGEPTLTTWRNPALPFTPGRLDYILVPPDVVEVVRAFALATDDLDVPSLDALGLEAALSAGLSDHLLVVADLGPR